MFACLVMISLAIAEQCYFDQIGFLTKGLRLFSVLFILVCAAFVGFMLYLQVWKSGRFWF